jgi:ferric-dicitrate binding protein FerR (iron transport regulator)
MKNKFIVVAKNNIDELFRDKINRIQDLPADVDWDSIKGRAEYQKQYPTVNGKIKRLHVYLSSAAAALILITLSVIFIQKAANETVSFSNLTAEIKELTLPDGNSVWLNKNSSVEYPSKINKEQYDISINGEAYIEISYLKSKKYTIKAQNARVFAETPTSFNIKARTDVENIDITVASGAVTIADESYRQGLALLVTQGNYCSVHKSRKLVYTAQNIDENYLAWKTGKLIFHNQPIATVSDILALYYDTKIELEDASLAYCLFSGTFEQKPIDIILNQIQADLNFTIINTGSKITFSGKGCL